MTFNSKNRQEGSSLIAVLLSAGIISIVLLSVLRTTNFGFKTSKSLEARSDLTILRSYVFEALDCAQSIPHILLNGTQSIVPITLKNSLGLPIIQSENGSALGNWKIRAQLDPKNKKIIIETGRFGNDNKPLKDPLTGKLQDWTNLFSGLSLCQKAFTSDEPKPSYQHMEYLGSNGCDSGGLVGGVADIKRRYGITMTCATGQNVISGGALCQHVKSGGFSGPLGIVQAISGSGSFLVASYPTPDKSGWYAECCVSTTGVLGVLGSVLNLKKENFPVGYINCSSSTIPVL